jgi:hypothetical protein
LQQHREWPWRHSPQVPGVRYARLRARSPTYGAVTLIMVVESTFMRGKRESRMNTSQTHRSEKPEICFLRQSRVSPETWIRSR